MSSRAHDGGQLKQDVKAFWEAGACGEAYLRGDDARSKFDAQSAERYALEPYLPPFARFSEGRGKDVLEVGVGLGADHLEWARSKPRSLTGVDLTERAIAMTRQRLALNRLESKLMTADAERLPFEPNSFDIVYSYGVLHHTPDTGRAIEEVRRVLRPGGVARIMIYHSRALTGYMLWIRYGLMEMKPWRSLDDIYSTHLESPGTKAYSVSQAKELFSKFSSASFRVQLSHGDLLEGSVGQRHQSLALSLARRLWPRRFISAALSNFGLALLIEARK
jgi:ubiquinone/menaquinone biosynthesis C-methylase UbiE